MRLNVCRAQAGLHALGYPSGDLDGDFEDITETVCSKTYKEKRGINYPNIIDDYIVELIEKDVRDMN